MWQSMVKSNGAQEGIFQDPPPKAPQPFGINLIGYLEGNSGLGVSARAIANLLESKGVPFLLYSLPNDSDRPGVDTCFAQQQVDRIEQLVHPINLYVLSAYCLQHLFKSHPKFLAGSRMHVANIWWEATHFPSHWLKVLSRFDGLLALSDFIAEICRNSLPMTPTLSGAHPLDLPEEIRDGRGDFGIPDQAVVFVASLDTMSDPVRKNPAALINAFLAAFPPDDPGVYLIIRLNNAGSDVGRQVVKRLQQLAKGDQRISLLLAPLDYGQILSLYASGDVYLSFHRGEGLGLGMLESMRLGKAVIATGWSGNLGFMNHSNSALLRYRLVPVSGVYHFLQPEIIGSDARWAKPEINDAVAWMQRLRHDPILRKTLGEKAKLSALEYQRRATEAHWLTELHDLWQSQPHLPPVAGKWSHEINRLLAPEENGNSAENPA